MIELWTYIKVLNLTAFLSIRHEKNGLHSNWFSLSLYHVTSLWQSFLFEKNQNKLEQNKRSAEKQIQENIFFMLTTVYDTTVDGTSWIS